MKLMRLLLPVLLIVSGIAQGAAAAAAAVPATVRVYELVQRLHKLEKEFGARIAAIEAVGNNIFSVSSESAFKEAIAIRDQNYAAATKLETSITDIIDELQGFVEGGELSAQDQQAVALVISHAKLEIGYPETEEEAESEEDEEMPQAEVVYSVSEAKLF
jgi:hypothetical protein